MIHHRSLRHTRFNQVLGFLANSIGIFARCTDNWPETGRFTGSGSLFNDSHRGQLPTTADDTSTEHLPHQPNSIDYQKPVTSRYSTNADASDKPVFTGWPSPILYQNLREYLAANAEVELEDPAMLDEHLPDNAYEDIDGEVFVGGVNFADVQQRALADCYFMAAFASLAHTNPEYLEQ